MIESLYDNSGVTFQPGSSLYSATTAASISCSHHIATAKRKSSSSIAVPAERHQQTQRQSCANIACVYCVNINSLREQRDSSVSVVSTQTAMATTCSYPSQNYNSITHHQQQTRIPSSPSTTTSIHLPHQQQQQQQQKDYSRPLHVDCSVEYELPNQAKPPPGGKQEPLLMIHPYYFRKIESQRRSPFINNLPPMRQPSAAIAISRRANNKTVKTGQPILQQMQPQTAAQYPTQYVNNWDHLPPLVPIATSGAHQNCCGGKRSDQLNISNSLNASCGTDYVTTVGSTEDWLTALVDKSPDKPEDRHILTGKYRQYLKAHRLHPYVPTITSSFPHHQIPQMCYNV